MKPPLELKLSMRREISKRRQNKIKRAGNGGSIVFNVSIFDGVLMHFALDFTLGRGLERW
jgi:hypothetical protein